MSAVWRTARASMRRRRFQTAVIALVVMFSSGTVVAALALLAASSGPFDRVFAEQQGAHLTATFDPAAASDAQLESTADLDCVAEAAGPFGQLATTLAVDDDAAVEFPATIAGRDDPAGPVDRLDLWEGRWAAAEGEIVLNTAPADPGDPGAPLPVGATVRAGDGTVLTVVGHAYSFGQTADAWVTADQLEAMGPTAVQMLYRLDDHDTAADVEAGLDAVTAAVPAGSLTGAQSYLALKERISAELGIFVVLLTVFGVLGLAVAVLIVANVVSGAVVSGLRHIGVLKAIGFTPRQVVWVYLTMVSLPALVGAAIGTVLGHFLAAGAMSETFREAGLGNPVVSPWADAAAFVGMPLLVLLAALAPAMRAHRLSAAEAISAGSAPRSGRGLRAHRWLSGTPLPRSVSLGLGLPFARPGRTALTATAVALGVTTATFTAGLAAFATEIDGLIQRHEAAQIEVVGGPGGPSGATGLGDQETQDLLASLPGASEVTANLRMPVTAAGFVQSAELWFIRGESSRMGFTDQLVDGRWMDGPGEAVASSKTVHENDLAIGDDVTLELGGRTATVTIVGVVMGSGTGTVYADWSTLTDLTADVDGLGHPISYEVRLEDGTDPQEYLTALTGAGLTGQSTRQSDAVSIAVVGLATMFALMLGTVAALGVFNTVALNARERRRDLGMLKSIGMTPRQVVTMMVTSMASLGVIGGLIGIALGVVAHREILRLAAAASQIDMPASALATWNAPQLALLALAGLAIAIAGAYLPARRAARLTIAEVLHSE
ncbi:ABC transporter permease [Glycomyces terrestris]|uniref:FtsX-like permease family protein n=1 Tax=Glycomyces terrestris TaxID=2493553 RepID=A0A426V383_9ACTN|nr:ABC transporter permease [Glycomyces terrestris]RRS01280.1 FtsX-like permease family protein [Glycomyces terrestris]